MDRFTVLTFTKPNGHQFFVNLEKLVSFEEVEETVDGRGVVILTAGKSMVEFRVLENADNFLSLLRSIER